MMQQNRPAIFTSEQDRIFRTSLSVPKSGYYRVKVHYAHNNWDAWVKLDIVGERGEHSTCIPPLPRKFSETTMYLYLFAGENQISMAPRFDHPLAFHGMEVLEETASLKPEVTPSADRFCLTEPRERRLTVVSYTGAPMRITAGDRELPFALDDKALYGHADSVETWEPAACHHIRLRPDGLSQLGEGDHVLTIHLPEGQSLSYTLTVERFRKKYDFQIVNLDVNHGNCVLFRLPNGKNMLIDTGTERCAGGVIFPYLEEQGIAIDYCLITHFHDDHMGSLDAILERYPLEKPEGAEVIGYIRQKEHGKRMEYLSRFEYLDSSLLCRYDGLDKIWDLGGVKITVLNCKYERDGGEVMPGIRDENETSVSMLVSYKGFRYYHGADNYASTQQRNLIDFTEGNHLPELQCHYMQANHHFHGDILPQMLHAINPVAVVVPANQTIFSRSAYMVDYIQGVVEADYPGKRLKDTFVSYRSGTVCALVNSDTDWHYETY